MILQPFLERIPVPGHIMFRAQMFFSLILTLTTLLTLTIPLTLITTLIWPKYSSAKQDDKTRLPNAALEVKRKFFGVVVHVLPCIVMSWVSPYCTSETRHCSIQFLRENVLMTKQSVSVREGGVDLNSSLKEFDCSVVLFL